MNKLRKMLFCGILMFTLVGCSGGYSEESVINAVVVGKEHIPRKTYTTVMSTGKTVVPVTRHRPEKFNVIVKYEELTLTIDSEAIFNSLENGDSIQVLLVKKFDSEGQEKRRLLKEL